MPKFPSLSPLFSTGAPILLMTLMAVSGSSAQAGSDAVNQRLKSSLNTMVQEVHAAESPAAKREILARFVGKVEGGAKVVGHLPFLSRENRTALNILEEKFGGYSVDLRGESGQAESRAGVADGDLDAYASHMQQDLEQADNGGIYLSTGAVIIVLLIILILM